MDEMKISVTSKFMTSMISGLIKKALQKKLGYKVGIKLNEVNANIIDGHVHAHLNIDCDLEKEEFYRILNEVN